MPTQLNPEKIIRELNSIIAHADELKVKAAGLRRKLENFYSPASPKRGNAVSDQEIKAICHKPRFAIFHLGANADSYCALQTKSRKRKLKPTAMIKLINDHPFLCILALIAFLFLGFAIFLFIITRQESKEIKKRLDNDRLSTSDLDWWNFKNY